MAPLAARFASARRMARHAPIRATRDRARSWARATPSIRSRALNRRYPNQRFIWLMGADNLAQFHRWRDWRRIAREVPIAVVARPGYDGAARAAPAMGWLRRFVRPACQAKNWTKWRLPALVLLRFRPDPTSATRLRAADPAWHAALYAVDSTRPHALNIGTVLANLPPVSASRPTPKRSRRCISSSWRRSTTTRQSTRLDPARGQEQHRRSHGDRLRPLDPPGRVDGAKLAEKIKARASAAPRGSKACRRLTGC